MRDDFDVTQFQKQLPQRGGSGPFSEALHCCNQAADTRETAWMEDPMARYSYERLTALDNSFLLLEKSSSQMHVASTMIFDAGPLRRPDGGIDAEAILDHIAAALDRIPRYRQKLMYVPIEDGPVWVDDDQFNLDYHIRHTALPRPGTDAQLKRLSARVMEQRLDRRRPLWEMWIVEGLEDGRFAIISKVHHCMIDGVSGVDLLEILMSPEPSREIPEPRHFIPRPLPSRLELVEDELRRRVRLGLRALIDLPNLLNEIRDDRSQLVHRLRALAETLGASYGRATPTPLNQPIGPHRRFDWLTMQLAEFKALRKVLGGSLNDLVLTVVTGAVRRFLERRQVNPAEIAFRIMAPVSVRDESERGALGNRVSAWFVELPIGEPDPCAQLEKIRRITTELKSRRQAVGAAALTEVAEWTPSTLLALGARNVTRVLPFNMVVTNVPGPQFPMYTLGARLLEVHPQVPLLDNLGLGIALMSYNGKLCWGFNADYDVVPDLAGFVAGVRSSFEALQEAAGAIRLAPQPPESATKREATSKQGAPTVD